MSRVGTEPRSPTYQSLSFGFSLGCWGWDTGVQSTLTVIVRRQRVASTVSPVKRLSESRSKTERYNRCCYDKL